MDRPGRAGEPPRRLIAASLLAVGALAAVLAWDLLTVKAELEAGREQLDELTLDGIGDAGLTEVIADAAAHFERAAARSRDSVGLRILGQVPGVDDQVAAIRRMTAVASQLGRAATVSAERLDERLADAGDPGQRVALLDAALQELADLDDALGRIRPGPTAGLVPPLRDAEAELDQALSEARAMLRDGEDLIQPVRDMLRGPTTVLLLAANNAEMAGGAGLTLSAGLLTIDGGEITLGDVVRAGDLRLDSSVPIAEHVKAIYEPTGVGLDLRSTTRSPDLATMGPIAARIMAAHGAPVDGVVVVDAVALRSLLEVSGPVEVRGKAISADNVLEEVLHANYQQFADSDDRPERVSYQGDIAKAVFDAITTRDVTPVELADALITSGRGRHLLLWSADRPLQRVWREIHLDGALRRDGLMVSFQNFAANKLDWYLRPEASLDVSLLPSGEYRARLQMTMHVPARHELDDASPYILGPSPEAQGVFLTVHLPAVADDISSPDPGGVRTAGREAGMHVRTFLADVPEGTTFTRTLEFTLPRSLPYMILLPSARLAPLEVTVDGVGVVDDATPSYFSWQVASPGPVGSPGAPVAVRLPALLGMAATVVATSSAAVGVRRGRNTGELALPSLAGTAAAAAIALMFVAAVVALFLEVTGPRV